jgi:hypothetical protein
MTCGRAEVGGFSPSTAVSSNNKADHYNITELLLKSGVKHHNPTTTHRQLMDFVLLVIYWYFN